MFPEVYSESKLLLVSSLPLINTIIFRHWVQLFVVLFILGASVAGCVYAGKHPSLNDTVKIATISCVVVFNAILLK